MHRIFIASPAWIFPSQLFLGYVVRPLCITSFMERSTGGAPISLDMFCDRMLQARHIGWRLIGSLNTSLVLIRRSVRLPEVSVRL
jgi:hypothetical protein